MEGVTLRTLVLGAHGRTGELMAGGRPNIGDAIVNALRTQPAHHVEWSDCYSEATERYDLPPADWEAWAESDALVVTLGASAVEPFAEQALAELVRANLTLPLEAAQRYVRERSEVAGGGRIIFIGSYAHRHPFSNGVGYCAAKAGLDMATRCLGWDLTPDFFTFIVHPFHVEGTPMWERVQDGVMRTKRMSRDEADEYARRDLRMERMQTPSDIAAIVKYLVESPRPEWMSGTNIELFGGTR